MKPKQFSKKLMLNKKTVAHLDNNEMNAAHGGTDDVKTDLGVTYGMNSCPTICYTRQFDPLSAPCCAGWAC